MVYRKALDIAEDKGLAKNLSEEAGAPPGAIQVMALCCAELTQKYDFLGAATPEALLIVAGTVWIAKDLTLIKKLNDLAALKEEAKHPQAQKPPEPKP